MASKISIIFLTIKNTANYNNSFTLTVYDGGKIQIQCLKGGNNEENITEEADPRRALK
jgi:hypothetical protein